MIYSNYAELKEKSFHIRWFFEIIRDGLRSKNDWQVFKNLDLFNVLLVILKFGNSKERVILIKLTNISFNSYL